jgi:hypothetical protein
MKLLKLAINLGAIAICMGTALALQLPRLNQKIAGQTPEADRKQVEQEKTRLRLLKQIPASGFGFNNVIADLTFLSFLQYFGDDKARVDSKTGYGISPNYFEVIVDRDPRFLYSYIFLSTSGSIYAGQPRRATELMGKAVKSLSPEQMPYAYTVWRRKGVDELLFLGDVKASLTSHLTAAEWAERADKKLGPDLNFGPRGLPEVDTIAPRLRGTAEFLRNSLDSKDQEKVAKNIKRARIASWSDVLQNAVDKKTLEIATSELNKLGMDVKIKENGTIQVVPRQVP